MINALRIWGSRMLACGIVLLCFLPAYVLSPAQTSTAGVLRDGLDARVAPVSSAPARPSTKTPATPKRPTQSIVCLAQNLYFEARGEPHEGIVAVAATVFNRMTSANYPQSVCGVVYQPYQYSWTLNYRNWSRRPPASFVQLARQLLRERDIITEEYPVTHFHRVDISPKWSQTLTYVATVGQHRFYGL